MNRILLIDDHISFREMLSFVIEREPEFEVAAQAGSLSEAQGMLEGVDIAVVDLDLPDGDGTELISELRTADPQVMVLVLTASSEREVHARAVEAGASGVLHKSAHIAEIIEAMRRLVEGEPILPAAEVVELLRLASSKRQRDFEAQQTIERLTPRERELLQALADGLSDKEISERLHISAGTVRSHFVSIFNKLGVNSRLQALSFAIRHNLVEES